MNIIAEPYNYPFDGDLKPENTALMIIDMQIDFLREGGWIASKGSDVSRCNAIVPKIRNLLKEARKTEGLTIIHTREGHRADLSDIPANKLYRSRRTGAGIGDEGPLGRFLIRGSKCWDIVPELYPEEGEIIIDKCGKGSFVATDLEQILRVRGIKNIILTGVTTECCVHTTMRDANDLGFECVLLEDCTQATTEENYNYHINHTKKFGLFGCLSNSEEIIKWLKCVNTGDDLSKEAQINYGKDLHWIENINHNKLFYKDLADAETLKSSDIALSRVMYEKIEPLGQVMPHTHEVAEIICFIKGRVEAYVNGSWKKFAAGDTIIVPAGCEHSVKNVDENCESEQISIFAPMR
ncbi:MAG: isochorismatase family protein [Lachnospira sp.]